MKTDKRRFYILCGLFAVALLLCCFVSKINLSNLLISLMLAAFAASFGILVKKRSSLAHTSKQVCFVLLTISIILITVYTLTGVGFGFFRTPVSRRFWMGQIIPYTLGILCAEYIRHVILAQETKISRLAGYVCLVLVDVVLFHRGEIFDRYASFWNFTAMVFLPSITANLLYTDVSKRYGFLPVVAYRVPLAIYSYLMPVEPNMPGAMLSFARLILPIGIMYFIRALYGKQRRTAPKQETIWSAIVSALTVIVMVAFIMLISCRFQYGVLVIASESMTGSQNKGDAVVFQRYEGEDLHKDQVIVFSTNGNRVVHRITRLQKINGTLRIYTKGDANETEDFGFITADNVVGTEVMTIPYLGYPTLWMRELFSKQQ